MQDFKKLDVWKRSHELAVRSIRLSEGMPPELDDLSRWLSTDATTIPAKIANACGRGRRAGFVRMLQVAHESSNALACHVLLAMDLGAIDPDDCWEVIGEIDAIKQMLTVRIRRASALRHGYGRVLRRRPVPSAPRTDN